MNNILAIMLFVLSFDATANIRIEKIPFDQQLDKAEAIGLVKLIEAKITYPDGKNRRIELLVEVLDGIYELQNGTHLKLLGSGFTGNDIGFNCIGSEAIVIMKKIMPPYEPEGFYATIGFEESVYHNENGMIIGLQKEPIPYEDAVKIIKHTKD